MSGRQRLASVSVTILKVWDVLQVKPGNFFCGGWKGTILQESRHKNMLFWIWLEATMRKWLNLTDRTTFSKQIVLNGSYLHVRSLRRMPYLRHGLYAATKMIFLKKTSTYQREQMFFQTTQRTHLYSYLGTCARKWFAFHNFDTDCPGVWIDSRPVQSLPSSSSHSSTDYQVTAINL